MEIVRPAWTHLREVVMTAQAELLVCSPFFSERGLAKLVEGLAPGVAVTMCVRLDPKAWLAGSIDPKALLRSAQRLIARGHCVTIHSGSQLHAKVYAADNKRILIGSVNLTQAGFTKNAELVVDLSGNEARSEINKIRAMVRELDSVSLDDLGEWVEKSSRLVRDAQASLREHLPALPRLSKTRGRILEAKRAAGGGAMPDRKDLERFLSWLRANRSLAGAKVIIDTKDNNRKRNSGKVTQVVLRLAPLL